MANRINFEEEGGFGSLFIYSKYPSRNKGAYTSTCEAQRVLTENQRNASDLGQSGVIDFSLIIIECDDPELQMCGIS